MKAQLKITGLSFGEFKMDELIIDSEMNEEELIAYAQMCVGLMQKAMADLRGEAPSTEPDAPDDLYHVLAGKYDGGEENCKYSGSFTTIEEAKLALDEVSDYPWARIEWRGQVMYN